MLVDDGLPMRPSGEWIRKKHHYLDRYCQMFSVSMRDKWNTVFADLLAGPGLCRIEDTGEIRPGSPLVAMDHPFKQFLFVEDHPENATALKQRVSRHPRAANAQVFQESWLDWLRSDASVVPERSLVLAFVDPTGVSQVPFSGMELLSRRYARLDVLMTIQHGLGIRWNVPQYLRTENNAADRFVGSDEWRKRVAEGEDGCDAIMSTFVERMGGLGFVTRKWQLVRNNSGGGLYYVCLFSRHERALEFWDKVVLKDERGQRAFDL